MIKGYSHKFKTRQIIIAIDNSIITNIKIISNESNLDIIESLIKGTNVTRTLQTLSRVDNNLARDIITTINNSLSS